MTAHELDRVRLVRFLLLLGDVGREPVQLLALLAERLRVLAQGALAGARPAAARRVPLAAARALVALAVVDERGVGLVLGVVEVDVRHHRRVLLPRTADEPARGN